jgi:hypothetical protein
VPVVEGLRRPEHQAELALRVKRLAAVRANMPGPGAVVYFAQRGERLGLAVALHAENRAEVLEDEDAEIADLAQEAAFGAGGLLPLRRSREQRRHAERGDRLDVRNAGERVEDFGLRG